MVVYQNSYRHTVINFERFNIAIVIVTVHGVGKKVALLKNNMQLFNKDMQH